LKNSGVGRVSFAWGQKYFCALSTRTEEFEMKNKCYEAKSEFFYCGGLELIIEHRQKHTIRYDTLQCVYIVCIRTTAEPFQSSKSLGYTLRQWHSKGEQIGARALGRISTLFAVVKNAF